MIRSIAGLALGTLSAALTYLGTDSTLIAGFVGALAALVVWIRADVLVLAMWDE